MDIYLFLVRTLEARSGAAAASLRVEAWDVSVTPPVRLATGYSGRNGVASLPVLSTDIEGFATGHRPSVVFRVYGRDQLVGSNEARPLVAVEPGVHHRDLPVLIPQTAEVALDEPKVVQIHGRVVASSGSEGGLLVSLLSSGVVFGRAVVDQRGEFAVWLRDPREEPAAGGPIGSFLVTVGIPGEPALHQETITIDPESDLTLAIGDIKWGTLGSSAGIAGIDSSLGLSLDPDLVLEKKYDTLSDIRSSGEVDGGEFDRASVEKLNALAQVDVVTSDVATNKRLVENGYGSIAALAAAEPADLTALDSGPGDQEASQLVHAARTLQSAMDALGAETALAISKGRTDDPIADAVQGDLSKQADFGGLVAPRLLGSRLASATGPSAYLVALLKAVQGVFGHPQPSDAVETVLHRPVRSLPIGAGDDEEIHALRVVVEVLAGYAPGGLPANDPYVVQAYEGLLAALGTTPLELAQSRAASVNVKTKLADRLGLASPSQLQQLQPAELTLGSLKAVFGLQDFAGGSPTAAVKASKLLEFRRARLERQWQLDDWGPREALVYERVSDDPVEKRAPPPPEVAVEDRPRPLIDPDLIPFGAVRIQTQTGQASRGRSLYTSRATALSAQAASARTLLEGDGLDQAVSLWLEIPQRLPTLPGGPSLSSLVSAYRSGQPVADQLARLDLDTRGLVQLADAVATLDAQEDTIEPPDERAVAAGAEVLVEVWKRRQFETWRTQEFGAGANDAIVLSPQFFQRVTLAEPPGGPTYRARTANFVTWKRTLDARTAEANALVEAGLTITRRAEAAAFPGLRSRLLNHRFANVTPETRGDAADRRLLLDVLVDTDVLSTRTSAAIDAVQRLLQTAREGTLHPDLIGGFGSPNAERIQKLSPWLASYEVWRSAIGVYLYPENAAHPTRRTHPTPAFGKLLADLGSRNGGTGSDPLTNGIAHYRQYVEDLQSLNIQASCIAHERIDSGGTQALTFAFAVSWTTGTLYWTGTVPELYRDVIPTHPWAPVPQAPRNPVVIGATPLELGPDRRYVVLFLRAETPEGHEPLLAYLYDLERRQWIASLDAQGREVFGREVSFPADELPGKFTGCVVQRAPSLMGTGDARQTRPIWIAWVELWTDLKALRISEFSLESLRLADLDGFHRNVSGDLTISVSLMDPIYDNAGIPDRGYEPYSTDGCVELAPPVLGRPESGDRAPQFALVFRAAKFANNSALDNAVYLLITDSGDVFRDRPDLTPPTQFPRYGDNRGGVRVRGLDAYRPATLIARYVGPDATRAIVTVSTTSVSSDWGPDPIDWSYDYEVKISEFPGNEWGFVIVPKIQAYPLPLIRSVSINSNSIATSEMNVVSNEYSLAHVVTGWGGDLMQRWVALQEDVTRPVVSETAGSRISPRSSLSLLTLPNTSQQRRERRHLLGWLLGEEAGGVNRYYLEEFAFALPLLVADYARRRRRYPEATAWARAVYDDTASGGYRYVYPLLETDVAPGSGTTTLPNFGSFDPLDPEAQFRLRPAARLRFALATHARLLLEVADDAFAADTPEQVARGRTFFSAAETTLSHPALGLTPPGPTMEVSIVVDEPPPQVGSSVGDAIDRQVSLQSTAHAALFRVAPLKDTVESVARSVSPTARSERALHGGAPDVGLPPSEHVLTIPLSLSLGFEVPVNPVLDALRARASVGLAKIRQGRNSAGLERALYTRDAGLYVPSSGQVVRLQPTPYRASFLIDRARALVQLAIQAEASFLQALERYDAEAFAQLQAGHQLEIASASVRLQDLRGREALSNVDLAGLQVERASTQREHFDELINAGYSQHEREALASIEMSMGYMNDAIHAYRPMGDGLGALGVLSAMASGASAGIGMSAAAGPYAAMIGGAVGLFGGMMGNRSNRRALEGQRASAQAQHASTQAGHFSQLASYERREQEWALQQSLAAQDVQAARVGVRIARERVAIVMQERLIAAMQLEHAAQTFNFLLNKFTSADLYRWMSDVFEDIFAFYVRLATATARLALDQLAFERQEPAPPLLAADYFIGTSGETERRGLTASSRLAADITRVEQHALETDRRKLQLVKTVSLSAHDPAAFENFRQTGQLPFTLPLEAFDRDHPGHYLRLVRSVSVTVVALVPPTQGIRASLVSGGLSPVVVEDDGVFREVTVRRDPERVALSSPYAATGIFQLETEGGTRYLPFEGGGVATGWMLEMPRASNPFSFGSIADVFVTIEYTALHSDVYRAQVTSRLDPSLEAARPLSLRDDFADAWYDVLNAELLPATPPPLVAPSPGRPLPTRSWRDGDDVVIEVGVERTDFPPNVSDLKLRHAALYAVAVEGRPVNASVSVGFIPYALVGSGTFGNTPSSGVAASFSGPFLNRVLSSRLHSWAPGGSSPVGVWRFRFDPQAQAVLRDDLEDLLLVISYHGTMPPWPH